MPRYLAACIARNSKESIELPGSWPVEQIGRYCVRRTVGWHDSPQLFAVVEAEPREDGSVWLSRIFSNSQAAVDYLRLCAAGAVPFLSRGKER